MDLFANHDPIALPLCGAELLYFEKVDFVDPALLQQLFEEAPWKSEEITVFGKSPGPGAPGCSTYVTRCRHLPAPHSTVYC